MEDSSPYNLTALNIKCGTNNDKAWEFALGVTPIFTAQNLASLEIVRQKCFKNVTSDEFLRDVTNQQKFRVHYRYDKNKKREQEEKDMKETEEKKYQERRKNLPPLKKSEVKFTRRNSNLPVTKSKKKSKRHSTKPKKKSKRRSTKSKKKSKRRSKK